MSRNEKILLNKNDGDKFKILEMKKKTKRRSPGTGNPDKNYVDKSRDVRKILGKKWK